MVRGDEIGELLRRTSRDVGREFLTSQFRPDLVNRWGSFLLPSTPTYATGSRFSGLWRRSFFWSLAAATLRTLFRMSPGRFSASLVGLCSMYWVEAGRSTLVPAAAVGLLET